MGAAENIPSPKVPEEGLVCLRVLQFHLRTSMRPGTFSSYVPIISVVFPAAKKPPEVASLVTKKPSSVKAPDTLELSSPLMIATTSFISIPPDGCWEMGNRKL